MNVLDDPITFTGCIIIDGIVIFSDEKTIHRIQQYDVTDFDSSRATIFRLTGLPESKPF